MSYNLQKVLHGGVYSACTANLTILEAVMVRAEETGQHVVIESTSNQVNQFGGYTGWKPSDYVATIFSTAARLGFPKDRIILGGDHLGPLVWANEPEETAMKKAKELVRQYVLAGFTKIHLDTSMCLGGDPTCLDVEVVARRGAELCKVAEDAFVQLQKSNPNAVRPVYVIGSEVPIPGGAQDDEGLQITRPEDFKGTVEAFKKEFEKLNLQEAWEQVVAVVVQPGVEFGSDSVHAYNREAAKELTTALKKYPNLTFEGHSTDYQTRFSLKQMVEDNIRILKVGPALTFALREGLFALAHIEEEIFRYKPDVIQSNFVSVLDYTMVNDPTQWQKHYTGNGEKVRFDRKYSLSDRCRYYLPTPAVQESFYRLIANLKSVNIPIQLISQYMPEQAKRIRDGVSSKSPTGMLKSRIITGCIEDYIYATKSSATYLR